MLFLEKFLIFFTALLVFAGAAAVALWWPPTYRSSASVLMQPPAGAAADATLTAQRITKEDLASELEILTSRSLIAKSVESLNREDYAFPHQEVTGAFLERVQATLYNRLHAVRVDEEGRKPLHVSQARWLAERLDVSILPSTHVLSMHFQAGEAEDAEYVLATHLAEYIPFRLQLAATGDENKSLMALERIQREQDLPRSEYERYKTRLDQHRIQAALDRAEQQTGVSLLDAPAFSGRRVFPPKTLLLIFGLVAGVIAGLGAGFFHASMDQRIHRREDVHRATRLPVILEIPAGWFRVR